MSLFNVVHHLATYDRNIIEQNVKVLTENISDLNSDKGFHTFDIYYKIDKDNKIEQRATILLQFCEKAKQEIMRNLDIYKICASQPYSKNLRVFVVFDINLMKQELQKVGELENKITNNLEIGIK